ncbi:MAG TPA: extracellular solute-binding protein [Candidatus Omnitrophica bacterium]|nr:extracellular solute-binding protein [Candidatus Omnitrophota bacterium]
MKSIRAWILLSGLFFLGCSPPEVREKRIVIWHWMTDRQPAFQELAERYQAQRGIQVDFQLYAPSEAYSQKVRAAAQGGNLPDIFGVLSEKRDFASLIKAGYILDLTPYMEEENFAWRNRFFPQALAVNKFSPDNTYGVNPGIYAVPIDMVAIAMVYNKNLLRKLGFNPSQPPQSFEEFLNLGRKIREEKLQGLVSGWGELWLIYCFAQNYAFNIMGKEKVLATIRGEVPYTDSAWIEVLRLFEEMKNSGIITNKVVSMVNKTAEQIFANEKAVFAFNGSWCVNVYKGMNPDLDYGVMLPPRISNRFPLLVWGGAGSSFMVNAHSPYREEAVKFLKWLTALEQQSYLVRKTNNLPAIKECREDLPQVLVDFSRLLEKSTHPNSWDVWELPLVNETLARGIQAIVLGKKTPQAVAQEVQRVKERELAKKSN